MTMTLWLLLTVLFLAYSNGANDNFKGVATLFGSGTTDYKRALWWATATTLAGSVASLFISQGLIAAFSGKGLVPIEATTNVDFLLAVGFGAASTVILATFIGIPISSTHALTGALVGAGLVVAGSVHLEQLGKAFFLPLLISPFLSLALTGLLYKWLHGLRKRVGVERHLCVCKDDGAVLPVLMCADGSGLVAETGMRLSVGELQDCREQYRGVVCGIDTQWLVDRLHGLSAGAVCFARGLNDTPKIVALLVAGAGAGMSTQSAMLCVGVAMAVGGLLSARRVAKTMSQGIVTMNHGQGFTANLVTAFMVIVASRFGVPVSTTHVSCGSLFGLGAVTGGARWGMIRNILLAWIATLPIAALMAAAIGICLA